MLNIDKRLSMRKLQPNTRKLAPLIVCSLLVSAIGNAADASTITDGNGQTINPIQDGHYMIRPDLFNDKVGFKEFQKLELSKGEILDFIFQAYNIGGTEGGGGTDINRWDVDTFVNFVSDQIKIDGIVNALSNLGGSLKQDSNLIFISPNGMVVGASGVLNVGSLSTFTPTQDGFNALREGMKTVDLAPAGFANAEQTSKVWNPNDAALFAGNAPITVNGMIVARGDVELNGSNVNVGTNPEAGGYNGVIIASVANKSDVLTGQSAADSLFNSLVSAGDTNSANAFSSANGKIMITSSKGINVADGAKIRNNSSVLGDTKLINNGTDGININGEVSNVNGNLTIENNAGAFDIGTEGLVRNNGTMNLTNKTSGTGLTIDGTVENDGTLNITNESGNNGLNIGGSVTNDTGVATVTNRLGGLNVSGTVDSNGTKLVMDNYGKNGIDISGTVNNNAGTGTITNHTGVAGAFDISGTVYNNGTDITLDNFGDAGFSISGLVDNDNGTVTINNHEGGLNVKSDGRVLNDGTSLYMNNEGTDGFTIAGLVDNNKGSATLTNNTGALNVQTGGKVINDGDSLLMENHGNGGFSIAGLVDNNNGNATLTNDNGNFEVLTGGEVNNSGTKLSMLNNGTGKLHTHNGSSVVNDGAELVMENHGDGGFTIAGIVDNNSGNATLTNVKADFDIVNGANIDNSGNKLSIDNSGEGKLNLETGAEVYNSGTALSMNNSGAGGFILAGDVTSTNGDTDLTNTNNMFDISGTVTNSGKSLDITNSGVNGLDISGTVTNQKAQANITNTAGALNISGNVVGELDNQKISIVNKENGTGLTIAEGGSVNTINDLYIANESGANGLNIAGSVINRGDTDISNKAGLLNISGTVSNSGNLDIYNHDTGTGFDISGTVSNAEGIANLTNEAGDFNILAGGTVSSTGKELNITNDSTGALNIHKDGQVVNDGDSLTMTNYGRGGFIVAGLVDNNKGNATLANEAGDFDVLSGGKVDNGTAAGSLSMTNKGNGKLNIAGTVLNDGAELNMTNEGLGGFIVDGLIDNNNGNATLTNTAGNFDINNEVNNSGDKLAINNSGNGALNVKGKVINTGAELTMDNSGDDGFYVSGFVDNDNGNATLTNTNSNFDIVDGGEINNSGAQLTVNNSGNGSLNVNHGANVINSGSGLAMNNSGDGGFLIDGNVSSTNGDTDLTNSNNMFDINGTVTNSGNSLDITNSGNGGLAISGTVTNQKGTANITNTEGALYIDGDIIGEKESQKLAITNKGNGTGLTIAAEGTVNNINDLAISNESGTTGLNIAGKVVNDGNADIKNTAKGGLSVSGTGSVNNSKGYLQMTNTQDRMLVESGANVTSSGTELNMTNSGSDGMHIQGHVTNTNANAKVEFHNSNSNMVIGHEDTDENIQSNADILIAIQNGNLRNYFADKNINPEDAGYKDATKTLITTTNGADLTINAQQGQIGTDLGLCDGGVCTGIGPNERNLTKSINTSIDGAITADSTGENALVNMASLDKDMHVNKIHAENGKVILLADDKYNKGATAYNIINSSADNNATPNLKGDAISAIASGSIGASKDDRITFIQTGVDIDIANENDEASDPHSAGLREDPILSSKGGVEFLAIKDVNIKGLDNADASKNDTRVCTISSREGSVNAEFSGETYIKDVTAQNEVNIVNRGPAIYIENLGGAPSRYATTGDYYGKYDGIVPEKADIKAFDLGTPEDPNTFENGHYPNSTIVIKNGTINGKGSVSHPGMDQDITVTADNAYVGGYYFNMGKHRYDDPNNPDGLSQVTKDPTTNPIVNAGDPDTPVSIRGKAVRPDDVNEIGQDEGLRSYYYWDQDGDGDPTNNDPDPDGSGQKDNENFEEPFDPDIEHGDDLVVPEPDPKPPVGDDDDDDQPDPPIGDDDDDDDQPDPPIGDDDDDDDQPDPPIGDDDDDDDQPDPPIGDDDDDDQPDPPVGDDDDDEPTPPPADMDDAKRTWKKEIDDNISVIDKRQFIRFDIEGNPNPIVFESAPEVGGILNISRGGVLLSHDKTLKVGDVVPVHLKYGDVEINADVKIVSANDRTAGGEFVDLDLATANKLLYLSLLMDGNGDINKDQMYANTQNGNLSTTGVDE